MASNLDIQLKVEGLPPSTPFGEVGTELLRTLQEALTNVRRHAEARNAWMIVKAEDGDLVAEVSDDGRGLGPDAPPGVGFRSMRERTAAIGGELEVESIPGKGTRVRFRVPTSSLSGKVSDTGHILNYRW